jgi:hypothetical protein
MANGQNSQVRKFGAGKKNGDVLHFHQFLQAADQPMTRIEPKSAAVASSSLPIRMARLN